MSTKVLGTVTTTMNPIGDSKFAKAQETVMRMHENQNGKNASYTLSDATMFNVILTRRLED